MGILSAYSRRLSHAAAGLILFVAGIACAFAQSQVKSFDLPASNAAAGIAAFARQADIQLLISESDAKNRQTNAVRGAYSVREALDLLLTGSGLTAEATGQDTFTIVDATRAEKNPAASLRSQSGVPADARLALAQTGEPAQAGHAQIAGESQPGSAVPEILVTGSKILNMDIQRTRDDVLPYVTFGAEDIQRSQAATLDEFLRTRLPMNASSAPGGQLGGLLQAGNQSSINLRGLGTDQTLVLVDGRRMPQLFMPGGDGFSQADLNGIPLASIERIEILPASAGAIYGGSATGGVVNVILKRSYSGFDVRASYGNTFASDVAQRRLEFSGGVPLEGGRTQLTIAGSYADANPLLVGERSFAARSRALYVKNNRDFFYGGAFPPSGATGNICSATEYSPGFGSCDGSALALKNGPALQTSVTSVPVGYAGPQSDDGAALALNDGQYNLDVSDDLRGRRASLLNNPTIKSMSANISREFSSRVRAYLDFASLSNVSHSFSGPAFGDFSSILLPADALNNPFTSAVLVSVPTSLSFTSQSVSETQRVIGGAVVQLGAGWTAATDYVWSRGRFEFTGTYPGGTLLNAAGVQALRDGALDILRDVNVQPLDYSPYLDHSTASGSGPFDTVLKDATVRVAGPAVSLPGGPMMISALLERRTENARSSFTHANLGGGLNFITYYPERGQTAESAYVEARAPLVKGPNARPWVRELEVQASVRRDRYETRVPSPAGASVASEDAPLPDFDYASNRVASTDYMAGLRYVPVESIALRASFGTGFLPASLSQIVSSPSIGTGFVDAMDSRRGNLFPPYDPELYPADVILGGNPKLHPEESKSWSAGVILTPQFAPQWRLSVDYTRIDKTGEILFPTGQFIVDNEALFSDRVRRAPLEDPAPPGYTAGRIIYLDESAMNISETHTSAIDLQLDYTADLGRPGVFKASAIGTRQLQFERQYLTTSPRFDSTGYADGPLAWKATLNLAWERGPLILTWSAQYYDGYSLLLSDPSTDPAQNELAVLNQGADALGSQAYHDVSVRYGFDRLSAGMLSNTELTLGVQNVFNREPPVLATSEFSSSSYSHYGDPRLRRYTISIRKSFD